MCLQDGVQTANHFIAQAIVHSHAQVRSQAPEPRAAQILETQIKPAKQHLPDACHSASVAEELKDAQLKIKQLQQSIQLKDAQLKIKQLEEYVADNCKMACPKGVWIMKTNLKRRNAIAVRKNMLSATHDWLQNWIEFKDREFEGVLDKHEKTPHERDFLQDAAQKAKKIVVMLEADCHKSENETQEMLDVLQTNLKSLNDSVSADRDHRTDRLSFDELAAALA